MVCRTSEIGMTQRNSKDSKRYLEEKFYRRQDSLFEEVGRGAHLGLNSRKGNSGSEKLLKTEETTQIGEYLWVPCLGLNFKKGIKDTKKLIDGRQT